MRLFAGNECDTSSVKFIFAAKFGHYDVPMFTGVNA